MGIEYSILGTGPRGLYDPRVPATLYQDIHNGTPRSVAWSKLENYTLPPRLRRLLRAYLRDLRLFEKLLPKGGIAAPRAIVDPRPTSAHRRPTKYSPAELKERRTAQIHHYAVVWMAKKSWEGYTPERKLARMLPAWRARRKRKDDRVIAATHPHIVRLLGRREILRRAGR